MRGGGRLAETWCTIPRKTLFLRLLCTKSESLFGDRPARIWCTIPRKPLLFRRRAPRLWGQRRRRRAGRGASFPANPCSFVDGHHVFGTKGAAGEPDVVLHSPQTLALSSTGTTSLGPKALPASVPISISLQKERIDDGTSGQSVPSSISTDFNRNSWN